jgi:hypothetical protein
MSEPIDDGGQAFPRLDELRAFERNDGESGYYAEASGGMSLRDYFAGQALNGMIGSDSSVDRTKVSKRVWAAVAYDFADAMLKVRGQ